MAHLSRVFSQWQRLTATVRAQWIPATGLPNQPIHGDFHLGNIVRTHSDDMLYLDFGCAARPPPSCRLSRREPDRTALSSPKQPCPAADDHTGKTTRRW
jgi:predicted trehalose synthase